MPLPRLLPVVRLACIWAIMLVTAVTLHAQAPKTFWSAKWTVDFFTFQRTSFSPDSRYFAMDAAKGLVTVYDAATGVVFRQHSLHGGRVYASTFLPGGTLLATGDKDGTLVVYDYKQGREVRTIQAHDKAITCIAYSNNGEHIITGSRDNSIKTWETATGKLIASVPATKGNVLNLRLSPGGLLIIAATSNINHGLRIYNAQTGEETNVYDAANVVSLDISGDGRYVATASLEHNVYVYDVLHNHLAYAMQGHTRNLTDVAFSADGKTLFSSGEDHTVIAWDLIDRTPIATMSCATKKINTIALSPNGRYLAVLDESGMVYMYDMSGFVGGVK